MRGLLGWPVTTLSGSASGLLARRGCCHSLATSEKMQCCDCFQLHHRNFSFSNFEEETILKNSQANKQIPETLSLLNIPAQQIPLLVERMSSLPADPSPPPTLIFPPPILFPPPTFTVNRGFFSPSQNGRFPLKFIAS